MLVEYSTNLTNKSVKQIKPLCKLKKTLKLDVNRVVENKLNTEINIKDNAIVQTLDN